MDYLAYKLIEKDFSLNTLITFKQAYSLLYNGAIVCLVWLCATDQLSLLASILIILAAIIPHTIIESIIVDCNRQLIAQGKRTRYALVALTANDAKECK